MSNYIQVTNAQGITVINDTYKNISLTQSKKTYLLFLIMIMKVFRKMLLAIMPVSIQIQLGARVYFLSMGILPVFFLVPILILIFMDFKQKTYFILALRGLTDIKFLN